MWDFGAPALFRAHGRLVETGRLSPALKSFSTNIYLLYNPCPTYIKLAKIFISTYFQKNLLVLHTFAHQKPGYSGARGGWMDNPLFCSNKYKEAENINRDSPL